MQVHKTGDLQSMVTGKMTSMQKYRLLEKKYGMI
jgi:hypothetical protein